MANGQRLKFLTYGLCVSVLSGCTPATVRVDVCTLDGKPAFAPESTKHWYGSSTSRPLSVKVYDDSMVPYWEAEKPHVFWDLIGLPISPRRKSISYGEHFHDWIERAPAMPLERDHHYSVEIRTDGGIGITEFALPSALPACPFGRK
jgi:hypothetical protein